MMARRLLLGLGLLVTLLGVLRVRLDVDVLELLPREMKEVQGLRLFLEHFSKQDEIILTLEGEDSETLAQHHTALAEFLRAEPPSLGQVLSEDVWGNGTSDGLGEVVAWLLANALEPEDFAQAVRGLQRDQRHTVLEDSLDTMASSLEFDKALTLAYDPYQLVQALRQEQGQLTEGGDAFTSADGTFRVLYITDPPQNMSTQDWVGAVKSAAETWRTSTPEHAATKLGYTGEPVFQTEIAASMESDMKFSGLSALLLTSAIFGLAYRRLRPLVALMAGLTATFALTLGIAGWLLPNMTVMSVGFASILIGLTVDYGVLLYQKSLSKHPLSELRRRTRKSIGWAAATTAAAFAALGLSLVPGIATLGQLVAIGILVGAVVMLWLFPLLLPAQKGENTLPSRSILPLPGLALPLLLALLVLAVLPLWVGLPNLNTSTEALRPRDSPAYGAMDQLQAKLTGESGTELVVHTHTPTSLSHLEAELAEHTADARIPSALIPNPAHQAANLAQLDEERLNITALRTSADEAGFEAEAMELTAAILTHWQTWQQTGLPSAPTSTAAKRLWSRLVSKDGKHLLATLTPLEERPDALWQWLDQSNHSFPVSWTRITAQLNQQVPRDLQVVSLGLGLAVILMLGLTFRACSPILLCLLTTTLTLAALCGTMRLLGWEWNFFSLGAILLTVGAGLDYSIHILLEHRQEHGEVPSVIRALGVCALSTVAGFASISWASNQGLASLGRVCALALTLNGLVSLIVLPWLLERLPKPRVE